MKTRTSAWDTALRVLARRGHSVAEIRRKLASKGFDADAIDDVVERLVERRLVDDRTLAYNHALRRADEGRRGALRVRRELLGRGFDPGLVEDALADAFPEDELDTRVRAALEKLTRHAGLPADPTERAKLARRLVRDGFPTAVVLEAIGEASSGEDGDDGIT